MALGRQGQPQAGAGQAQTTRRTAELAGADQAEVDQFQLGGNAVLTHAFFAADIQQVIAASQGSDVAGQVELGEFVRLAR